MKFSLADLELHPGVPSFLQFHEDERLTLALNSALMDHNFSNKSNHAVLGFKILISSFKLTKSSKIAYTMYYY